MRRLGSAEGVHQPLWPVPAMAAPMAAAAPLVMQQADREELDAKERGYREGIERGTAEGRKLVETELARLTERMQGELKQAQAKLDASREQLGKLFGKLSSALDDHARHAEEVAVEVAYAAVARFLGERYADRTLMEMLCRHALSHAGHEVTTVRVSKQDAELLTDIESIVIAADARLSPGQCTLETRLGHYETGLDVRLDLIKHALISGLDEHRSEAHPE